MHPSTTTPLMEYGVAAMPIVGADAGHLWCTPHTPMDEEDMATFIAVLVEEAVAPHVDNLVALTLILLLLARQVQHARMETETQLQPDRGAPHCMAPSDLATLPIRTTLRTMTMMGIEGMTTATTMRMTCLTLKKKRIYVDCAVLN